MGRAFSGNQGLLTELAQTSLASSTVAIPGVGGTASTLAHLLARMGVGQFIIADPGQFDLEHFNHQFSAKCSTVRRSKAEVIRKELLDINPTANVREINDSIGSKNIAEFLRGASVVVDCLSVSAVTFRRVLYPQAEKKNIPVVLSVPIGHSCGTLVFAQGGMSFEKYFDFSEDDTDLERILKFAVGLTPKGLHRKYMGKKGAKSRGASSPLGSNCATLSAAGIVIRLLLAESVQLAPYFRQWDAFTGQLRTGKLSKGNRSLQQRLRLWLRRKRQHGEPSFSSKPE